jgi:hypothetical protein
MVSREEYREMYDKCIICCCKLPHSNDRPVMFRRCDACWKAFEEGDQDHKPIPFSEWESND